MSRRRSVKPRSFFEPWTAAKSVRHGAKPNVEGLPEDAAENILAAWERVDRDADWVLWGTGMAHPAISRSWLTGKAVFWDDQGIIAVRRSLSTPEGSPTNEDIAERIADCVNSLAGVGDPESFVADVRALLLSYVIGECVEDPREDPKVVSLLARCIPPEEFKGLNNDHD